MKLQLTFKFTIYDDEMKVPLTHKDQSSSGDKQDSPCPYFDKLHEQGGNEKFEL